MFKQNMIKQGILKLVIIAFVFIYSCKDDDYLFRVHHFNTTNINFANQLKDTPELNILTYLYYYNGAGIASGDFNNDGLEDLYFVANQGENKLYINEGDFGFRDATTTNILDDNGWSTGVTSIDINNDGLLDIYVCKVGDYRGIKGINKLFINEGIDSIGNPIFVERAKAYNLDIVSFSTQAVFLDYDLDGDLDMFLLNHSVHPNGNYGKGSLRKRKDSLSGDRLYRNDKGYFVDVSDESGIFQGKIGYGLSASVSDLNQDGYPDIYVCNDFFENDYLYINKGDGAFEDLITKEKSTIGHTSHFSMGQDIADINNDGLYDIVSLDMLPEDIVTYKASGTEYPYQTYQQYLRNGYSPQYMHNNLQLNLGNNKFSEIAFASGIAATEWSWAPLLADFDNDGFKDLFVTNGVVGVTNDMDFISFIANENIQKRINQGMSKEDMALINELPSKKITNYIFRNNGDLSFSDYSKKWFNLRPSFSNGCVTVDLDNDGDLDIVVNNINEFPHILENQNNTLNSNHSYLKIQFQGPKNNIQGIGAKVNIYTQNQTITQELFPSRGYLSSLPSNLNIGLGDIKKIDSLEVIWPNKSFQKIKNVSPNQELKLIITEAEGNYYEQKKLIDKSSFLVKDHLEIVYKHKDNSFIEFTRAPLIPYMNTYQGPAISVCDINKDGLEDVFLSGAKTKPSQMFFQNSDGTFDEVFSDVFNKNKLNEDTDHLFVDIDSDGYKDLIVISGGNEFKNGIALQPRLYKNKLGTFIQDTNAFKNIEINASVVIAEDYDGDGDIDLFLGSNAVPHNFGKTPINYFLNNDGKGNFQIQKIEDIGLIQDATFVDYNGDTFKDLVVVGYWMPITIIVGSKEGYKENNAIQLKNSNGLWNCVKVEDLDKDGDLDILAGNWGLNTRLKASKHQPITLYLNDFDDNGTIDPIMTYYSNNKEVVFSTKEELTKQMPFINKKYLSFTEFSEADFKELFPKNKLNRAVKKYIYTLETSYFENNGNNEFISIKLPFLTQTSCVNSMYLDDFDNNGFKDILMAGNRFDINTQLGQLDASFGQTLLNYKGKFKLHNKDLGLFGTVRDINKINIKDDIYYLIGVNNDSLQFLRKE